MVCGAFLRVCLRKSVEEIANAHWPNTALTTLDYDDGWKLLELGDASHLDGLLDPSAHGTGA